MLSVLVETLLLASAGIFSLGSISHSPPHRTRAVNIIHFYSHDTGRNHISAILFSFLSTG